MAMSSVEFCFDIVCPYAYIASQRIVSPGGLVSQTTNNVEWVPVLVGGLYDLTKAPQGKAGSASQIMPPQKQTLLAQDLKLQLRRHNVTLNWPKCHPQRSLDAQRLLCYAPHAIRPRLADLLFKAYWVHGEDITQTHVLMNYAKQVGLDWNGQPFDQNVKDTLEENTRRAADRGAFGVPSFFINKEQLIWGADRVHFVEFYAGNKQASLPRFQLVPKKKNKLRFYMDFSSPWCFLGWTQLHRVIECAADVEIVPILLGALFRNIGTPNMPMTAMSDAKRNYMALDMGYWQKWWGESLSYPSFFPIRTVLPLRVAIVSIDTADCIFRAAWQKNLNIGDEAVLKNVLETAGFDAEILLRRAKEDWCKEILRGNTQLAMDRGVIGVPTYEVGSHLIWGQDRIDLVQDLLYGWESTETSRL